MLVETTRQQRCQMESVYSNLMSDVVQIHKIMSRKINVFVCSVCPIVDTDVCTLNNPLQRVWNDSGEKLMDINTSYIFLWLANSYKNKNNSPQHGRWQTEKHDERTGRFRVHNNKFHDGRLRGRKMYSNSLVWTRLQSHSYILLVNQT